MTFTQNRPMPIKHERWWKCHSTHRADMIASFTDTTRTEQTLCYQENHKLESLRKGATETLAESEGVYNLCAESLAPQECWMASSFSDLMTSASTGLMRTFWHMHLCEHTGEANRKAQFAPTMKDDHTWCPHWLQPCKSSMVQRCLAALASADH